MWYLYLSEPPAASSDMVCVSVPSPAPASANAGVVSTMQTAIPAATIRFIQFIFLRTLIFINPILPVKIVGDLIICPFCFLFLVGNSNKTSKRKPVILFLL